MSFRHFDHEAYVRRHPVELVNVRDDQHCGRFASVDEAVRHVQRGPGYCVVSVSPHRVVFDPGY